ncbi:hypothetical protein U9M48_018909 [Paspalum notatum var. saurae]|uniref:Uncharacterized protein n=1 Tax=Paspalum notatum var. saurae TaxID=547442 RepID=A0AAQ3TAE5_PASNO
MLLPSPITAVFGRFVGHPQPPYGAVSLLPETSLSSARRHPFYVSNVPAILSSNRPVFGQSNWIHSPMGNGANLHPHVFCACLTQIRAAKMRPYGQQPHNHSFNINAAFLDWEALRLLGNQPVFCSNLI